MRVAALAVATLALAGCAAGKHTVSTMTSTVTSTKTVTLTSTVQTPALGVQDAHYFGRIVSITKADPKRYLLVLRPESFLVGVTANVANAEQQGTPCAPLACPGVEDDHLVVPAGTQKLTFVLPAKTTGTVLTVAPGGEQATSTVSAAQLAALVAGAKAPKLIEPLDSGVWLAVDVDKVTSFAQQFQP
jgi:hypothetical protein